MNSTTTYDLFDPQAYLNAYYGEIGTEADGLLRFLVDVFAGLDNELTVLEFGGGPTIIGLIAAAQRANEIHYCDYLLTNRAVIEEWLAGSADAFDWSPFIAQTLQYEAANTTVAERAEQIRRVLTRVMPCDIFKSPPVATDTVYDVVMAHYCLDAVTDSRAEWINNIRKLKTLLKPGGTFVMSSLREAHFSDFGGSRFPNVYLMEEDVREALLAAGFRSDSVHIESAPADHAQREYSGVIFASAVEL